MEPATPPPKLFKLPATFEPGVSVRPEAIIRPDLFTLYFSFFGTPRWQTRAQNEAASAARRASLLVNRPLTQPELDFLTESSSRRVYHTRLGVEWGVVVGFSHALINERIRKWFTTYLPPRQEMSRAEWYWAGIKNMYQLDRQMFKSCFLGITWRVFGWGITGGFLASAYAASTAAARLVADLRMEAFREDLQRQDRGDIQERKRNAVMIQAYLEKNPQAGDVSVPQGQASEPDWYGESPSASTSSGSMDTSPSPSDYPRIPAYNAPSQQASHGKGFFDDDASPIAADYQEPTSQGSAWDRIRQQNQQGSSPASQQSSERTPPTASGNQDSSSGSSWDRIRSQGSAFSTASSDSQRQRNAAQAEFNQMLDAERARGTDGDSGSKGPVW
ncbi:putative endo-1,3(4)-beta-glucanase [Aspergillus undulatus]|uniref:putative endo-1,3(4)-beta-glucanase n=1 Tax=Aspergillus undulatus TaxID=1810928 RepID=UPI003CCCF99A